MPALWAFSGLFQAGGGYPPEYPKQTFALAFAVPPWTAAGPNLANGILMGPLGGGRLEFSQGAH